ncbi:hypothetical protein SEVIR_3G138400v4 [Setaria viridis]|uniref:Uncharacterized protein n=2 Tax=Setaria TaxID=4554 RepID=A0A368QEP4_SETIT|nr:uncharacterized protein LOC101775633 [Setaria italica]XP_034587702.1 uncharacterized protein LOC117850032 [Setaria viridis]RCV16419.1 hypothetical protein SETIT_3G136500v2 [Setaria italica]TKW25743.1 hypothetical protein SEVIR_3G138400v2 [Setaria viridis]
MEAEAFPIQFTRGVRAYWRRRKYHRLEAADGGKSRVTRQLGASRRGGGGWGAVRRLRVRVRVALAAPRRALARARDAYVGAMLALARRASAITLPGGGPDGLWTKRVPRRKQLPAPSAARTTEFEQRLIFEIYKSIVASKELTAMLHSSAGHLPQAAAPMPANHLLDM